MGVASGSLDKAVSVWDGTSGERLSISTLEGRSGDVNSALVSADERRIASGSGDGTVKILDGASGDAAP